MLFYTYADNCQILVGIVMMGDGPSLIVFAGNRLDQTTVRRWWEACVNASN